MARLDIRDDQTDVEIDEIRFHDAVETSYIGEKLTRRPDMQREVCIKSNDGDRIDVNKDNVDMLIKALQKAKQLGWFNDQ